eukprot:672475-Prymnesium_polylepis.1
MAPLPQTAHALPNVAGRHAVVRGGQGQPRRRAVQGSRAGEEARAAAVVLAVADHTRTGGHALTPNMACDHPNMAQALPNMALAVADHTRAGGPALPPHSPDPQP